MNYETTALRKRPQRFCDLIGQEWTAEALRNSVASGKIAHAYLFSGPRGCGKTSTARILAKAVNCENPQQGEPCGKCKNCMEITSGACPDVFEIDGASNTGVNDVRQIRDNVMFAPSVCRYKIIIIDEVHMLSDSAFNALLKPIEEPPEYVIFIFATTEIHKVLATIKSRCQHFNFRLVSPEKLLPLLKKTAEELGVKADDESLSRIILEGTGSVRDTYTLFDQAVAFCAGDLSYSKIRDMLGLISLDDLNAIFCACAKGEAANAVEMLDKTLQTGISIEQFVVNCADFARNLLFIKSGVSKSALLGADASLFSGEVISAWDISRLERALSILLQLFRDISFSLNPRFEVEAALARLCELRNTVTAAEMQRQIASLQALLSQSPRADSGGSRPFESGGARQAAVASAKTASEGGNLSDADGERAREILAAKLKQSSPFAAAAIETTFNWKIDGQTLTVFTERSFGFSQLEKSIAKIEAILPEIFFKKLKFAPVLAKTSAPQEPKHDEFPAEVRILMEMFRGTAAEK